MGVVRERRARRTFPSQFASAMGATAGGPRIADGGQQGGTGGPPLANDVRFRKLLQR